MKLKVMETVIETANAGLHTSDEFLLNKIFYIYIVYIFNNILSNHLVFMCPSIDVPGLQRDYWSVGLGRLLTGIIGSVSWVVPFWAVLHGLVRWWSSVVVVPPSPLFVLTLRLLPSPIDHYQLSWLCDMNYEFGISFKIALKFKSISRSACVWAPLM